MLKKGKEEKIMAKVQEFPNVLSKGFEGLSKFKEIPEGNNKFLKALTKTGVTNHADLAELATKGDGFEKTVKDIKDVIASKTAPEKIVLQRPVEYLN